MQNNKENMTLNYITQFIDKKINKNSDYITVTFYELRIKENLSLDETDTFVHYSTLRLKNLGYTIYYTGENYIQDGKTKTVRSNILYVAIKRK